MSQLNLFTSKVCHYCGGGSISPHNPYLWDGFQDQDTGELVCKACRGVHYYAKAKAMGVLIKVKGGYEIGPMTYSEFPVML